MIPRPTRLRATAAFALVAVMPAVVAGQPGSPAGPVDPRILATRRAALMDRVGDGLIILRSADSRSMYGDYPQDSDFRQDNDFFYLTGLETPGSWLVLRARTSDADEVILFLPPRDRATEEWTGPRLGPGAEARELTGIPEVRSADRFAADLRRMLAENRDLPVVTRASRTAAIACETQSVEPGLACPARSMLPVPLPDGVRLLDAAAHTARLRQIKDADELARLRTAISITAEALRAGMRAVRPGAWEYEVEAVIEYEFRRRGAERVGFPSIIGSGPNSTVLHYDRSRRQMQSGDLVVMDVGAEFGYYTGDVTRTVPVDGRFTKRQRALYELVLGAQQAAIDAVRPGVTLSQLGEVARRYMRANSRGLCGAESCDRYFTHGLSHWLGMDVHDVGSMTAPLEPGMVLTIEPGIYIPGENIGIRIEDDILVTDVGCEVLSAAAPRMPDEIEALMVRS